MNEDVAKRSDENDYCWQYILFVRIESTTAVWARVQQKAANIHFIMLAAFCIYCDVIVNVKSKTLPDDCA